MAENAEPKTKELYALPLNKLQSQEQLVESSNPVRVEFNREHQRYVNWLLLFTALILLLWSWFTELDEIAQAPGQLIPAEEVQPIRAPFDSKIEEIYVKAGDSVKKGDLLLRLDAKTFRAELDKYEHELKIAERELERHEHAYNVLSSFLDNSRFLSSDLSSVTEVARAMGELYGAQQKLERAELDMKLNAPADLKKTPEVAALKLQHKSIVEQGRLKEFALSERRRQFALDEAKLIRKVSSLEKQIELQNLAVKERRYSLECTQKQLAAYEEAFKSGASSKTECLDAKMRVEDMQRYLTVAEAKSRELEGQLEASKHELAQLQSRNSMQISQMEAGVGDITATEAQVNSRLRSAERNLNEARAAYHVALRAARSTQSNEQNEVSNLKKQIEQLKASVSSEEHSFQKGELRSPVEGNIALLNLQGRGEVVQHGQDLLTIVPAEEELLACLHVPNEEIAFVHKGELVKMQFPAYPYQQYGTISGVVTLIDEFPTQNKEFATSYKVFLKPQRDWILCRGRKIALRKGLEVEAQLVLRKKRLLISILAPLLKLQYSHFKA
ncbi:MAG: HlyD family efflux transporter periplasmic adaptor subunit [Candidatus Obscuribacterales bacterium]|nr:HlyD family efflux transporter periplasmic adaptor subunit [Candidatus Obscuribacterales bacterium]